MHKVINRSTLFSLLLVLCLNELSCRRQKPSLSPLSPTDPIGFDLLARLPGIWEGPLVSTTSVGNFPFWKVDLRPISSGQVSSRSELDSANDIHLSFFIARYGDKTLLCFRNGGYFSGMERISYLLLDSTASGYYRFSEPVTRGRRAYAEVHFPHPDSLILSAYTNKMGTTQQPVLHIRWNARRLDTTAAQAAIQRFSFPQKSIILDLSQAFQGRTEAIYYSPIQNDPYPSSGQPYLGTLRASYQHGNGYTPDSSRFVILFTTTKPLLEGMQYYPDRLRYITRYVRLPSTKGNFTFRHMHPGSYYLYALYDVDGDGQPSSGDWFSISGTSVEVLPETEVQASAALTFRLP
ncbi:MAG: hypothetical protein N2170_05545 [Bacteroidia bacterium]|nr:hypothetical protein [Bacteroidia bacterium]